MVRHKNKNYEVKPAAVNFENPKDVDNMRFTVRNDYAFKKLFGRPANIIILQEFLSVVLEMDNLARCVSIHILGEEFPLTAELHSIYRVMNVKTFQPFSDDLEFHFLDLTKLKATEDTDLERWLRFIQTEDQTVREELGRRNAVMQYANTVMNQFYADKKERLRYEAALRYESDRATLLEAGIDKGIRIGEAGRETRRAARPSADRP